MWYYFFVFVVLLHPSIIPVKAYPHGQQWESSTAKRSFGVPGDGQIFDYVVVGGGTAGLTIASRLAEDASLSVAVIEAGGFYEDVGNTSVVPAYDVFFAGTDPAATNPAVDWGFVTTPQKVSGTSIVTIELDEHDVSTGCQQPQDALHSWQNPWGKFSKELHVLPSPKRRLGRKMGV